MIKKISIICLVLMFSILPVLTLSGCGLSDGAEFEVTTGYQHADGTYQVSKNQGKDLESFLSQCLITFKPGDSKYFIVRSEEAAKNYKGHTYEKKSEYTYYVYYNEYDRRVCKDLMNSTTETVNIVVSGFTPYKEGDTSGNAVFSMYGKSYTFRFYWL